MKDIIIILGGGIEPDGSLPEIPKLRINKGIELFKSNVAPKIIVSGNYGFWLEEKPIRSEAEAMKEYALGLGVSDDAILKEDVSKDTIGNAYFCRLNFLEPNSWHNVVVVTSEYHIPRTKYIFEKVLGNGYQIEFVSVNSQLTLDQLTTQTNKENKTIEFLKKWFDSIEPGDMNAIRELMYTKHPGYAENPEVTKEQLLKILGRT